MAKFSPKKFNINSINNGNKYELGDSISPNAINAPIEASYYAQDLAEKAHSKADEALNSVSNPDGTVPALSAYPIGAIYIATSNILSPAELFGGQWEVLNGGNTISIPIQSSAPVFAGAKDVDPLQSKYAFKMKAVSGGAWVNHNSNYGLGVQPDGSVFDFNPQTTLTREYGVAPSNLYATISSISAYAWKRIA